MCTGCQYDPACIRTDGAASCECIRHRSGPLWRSDLPEHDDRTVNTSFRHAAVHRIRSWADEDTGRHKGDHSDGRNHDWPVVPCDLYTGHYPVYTESFYVTKIKILRRLRSEG